MGTKKLILFKKAKFFETSPKKKICIFSGFQILYLQGQNRPFLKTLIADQSEKRQFCRLFKKVAKLENFAFYAKFSRSMPQKAKKGLFREISDFGLTTKNLRGLAKFRPFFRLTAPQLVKKGLKNMCF